MALGSSARLGVYQVVGLLGAGGMGEVYRAVDTRLDRQVAIKVLPEAVRTDPERVARFEREAKLLASLNHQHIAGIYGLEQADAEQFIVMELVEGPTLADRIAESPIPVTEALQIAKQIAEALEAAHEHGVIHRDLKPANIKLRPDGTVKVLDFGLAKAFEPGMATISPASLTNSPTLTSPLGVTGVGVLLGTAAYMAPEQARGRAVDKRVDIWAFGCVLFEMLTGRRAFAGEHVTDALASVVRDEPEWNALPAETPAAVRHVLRRCLRKDPHQRQRDLGDVRLDLAEAVQQPSVARVSPAQKTLRLWWAVAALAVMAASYGAGLWRAGRSDSSAVEWQGDVLGGPAVTLGPRVSPDGQMLAFQAMVDGLTQVGIMRLQSGQWTILTNDRSRGSIINVAWAADGSSVYFDRLLDVPRGVFRVPVLGGEPRLVFDQAMSPEPLPDGSLIAVRLNDEGQRSLVRFWPETGRVEAMKGIVSAAMLNPSIRVSPEGRDVLFFGRPLDESASRDHLYEINLGSGRLKRLGDAASFGDYQWTFPLAVTREGAEALVDIVSGNLHQITAFSRSGSGPPRTLLALTGRPLHIDIGRDGSLFADLIEQPAEILVGAIGGEAERTVIAQFVGSNVTPLLPLPDGRILINMRIAGRNRTMTITRNGTYAPLFETQDETGGPIARVGHDTVALMLGSAPDRVVALASTTDGRIVRRLDALPALGIGSLAGSPDGRTLYYAAAGQISAMELDTGTSRVIHPGQAVAIDPAGEYAVVSISEKGSTRLMKVDLSNGRSEEIQNRSTLAIAPDPLAPNAIARDGRIAVRIAPKDSWFWSTGVLDPRTGSIDRAWPHIHADMNAGWTDDGRLMAVARTTTSTLWRFVPRTQ